MSERASYSRVYWSIVDDSKFVTIYDQDSHLAAWLRLLLIADQAHPASAHLPSNVRRGSIKALSEANLIDLLPGSRYRIHGLDAERERRRVAATSRPPTTPHPNGPRPVPERSPNGPGTPGLRRAEGETSRAEPTARATDENHPWKADETEALAWLSKHGCDIRPGNGYHQKLITAVEAHGITAVIGMLDRMASAGVKNGDVKGLLFGAIDTLNARTRPDLRALEQDEAREERADVRSQRIQRQMWERRLELYRQTGQWDEAWGAKPKEPVA